MGQIAFVGVVAAGSWLVFVGGLMALRPRQALHVLRLTASTRIVNNVEQGLRLLAGLALLIHSPLSKFPRAFEVGGWFVIISSLVLLVVPLSWHSAYAIWWANRFTTSTVRLIAPASVLAGIGLIYAAL